MDHPKYPCLIFDQDFDERAAFDMPLKGRVSLHVETAPGVRYPVYVIDRVRLQQDLEEMAKWDTPCRTGPDGCTLILGGITNVSIEEDGWELENVVEANQYSPTTFHIPSEETRTNLRIGDRVKLIFLFPCEDDEEEFPVVQGERMWVTVRQAGGTEYQGELETAPSTSDVLHAGDLIRFGPEHIAAIMIRKADQHNLEYQALKNAEYKEYNAQVIWQIREFKQELLNIEARFSTPDANSIAALITLLRNFNADAQTTRLPPGLLQVHDRYRAGARLLAAAADHFEYGMQSHDQTLLMRAQEEAEQGRTLIDMAEDELKRMS